MYKHEQGQSLVEFALSFTLLMIIMLGILDLGRAFNAAVVVTNAAREGAYYGSMHPTDTAAIEHRASDEVHAAFPSAGVTVAVSPADPTSRVSGIPLRVTVEYEFPLISNVVGTFAITLRRSAEMVIY